MKQREYSEDPEATRNFKRAGDRDFTAKSAQEKEVTLAGWHSCASTTGSREKLSLENS